ncbi:ectonucleotide pyrophosphatase/phosphodiesterase family member 5-like [Plakobranchus ocellatus]|uniref:Ectonucleotide pyrophosphatase/phosphodiesterase family member 5-like n=1 Tax=Plakobranchus ocellatus TaxID=259542 RepID=A0AAV4DHL8_9GAST|nr:ectonucleotide pyrophosphatase/phosphodiesterase family member 5-like [Plakobranchus ocellatus]
MHHSRLHILTELWLFLAVVAAHFEKNPSLLLISFDGFRWNYLTRAELPNIQRIIREGVHATEGVKNVFDTSTLPNHWTMVTGLYPESHGVIGNFLRDVHIEKKFIPKYIKADYHNDYRYYDDGGEPIWVTNQFQGGRSGSVMWWGSENVVKWTQPTFQMPYDDNITFTERVDVMVKWLSQENPVNLGLIYCFEPDHIAHTTGPESSNVTEAIKNVDVVVGYLLSELEKKDLLDDINIIITSDHGMTTTSNKTLIFLDDIINKNDYDILVDDNTISHIFPHEGKLDDVYQPLKKASQQKNSHFHVYLARDIPERFHMKNNPRIPPIVAFADLHYRLVANASRDDDFPLAGCHGYDNEEKDMRPFFVAMGPSFRKGFSLSTFNIVDLYPLMCRLLGLKPAPNNGSLAVVSQFLLESEQTTMTTFVTYILALVLVNGIGAVFAVAAFRQHRNVKPRSLRLKLSPLGLEARYAARTHLMSENNDYDDNGDDSNEDTSDLVMGKVHSRARN